MILACRWNTVADNASATTGFKIAIDRFGAIYVAPHKKCGFCNKEIGVNIFENATSIVLAIAAHALAVGLVVAL